MRTTFCLALVASLLSSCGGAVGSAATTPTRPFAGCGSEPVGDGLLLDESFVADPRSGALGDALGLRQRGVWAPAPWVVDDGSTGAALSSPLVRVSDASRPGLELRGNVAVRLDRPLILRSDRHYRIEACIDPVAGDVESLGWVSIALATEETSIGWVTAPEMILGFLVRSRGAIQIFTSGQERETALREGLVSPRTIHAVVLELVPEPDADPPTWRLEGELDGQPFQAELGAHDPTAPVFLHLGAHFHPGDVSLSRVEQLRIRELR